MWKRKIVSIVLAGLLVVLLGLGIAGFLDKPAGAVASGMVTFVKTEGDSFNAIGLEGIGQKVVNDSWAIGRWSDRNFGTHCVQVEITSYFEDSYIPFSPVLYNMFVGTKGHLPAYITIYERTELYGFTGGFTSPYGIPVSAWFYSCTPERPMIQVPGEHSIFKINPLDAYVSVSKKYL